MSVTLFNNRQTIPTFNEVRAIGTAGTNFTVSKNVANVSGTCGGLVRTSTPTDIIVRVPTLNETDDAGFRVKLADNYISSMNIFG